MVRGESNIMSNLWENNIKPVLKTFGVHKLVHKAKFLRNRAILSSKNPEEIFRNIYKNNDWKGAESVSGQGSDLNETGVLLEKLPHLFAKYNIGSIIDLPCGDYNWMQHLKYDFDSYVGIDIVEDIIQSNQEKYADDKTQFVQKNCLEDRIDNADLIMVRDLLIHFSDKDVYKFLENLKRSNITYLLTTHFINETNFDIATGQWRPINLCAKPFGFRQPMEIIIEETKMYDNKYAKTKTMSLWRLEDL